MEMLVRRSAVAGPAIQLITLRNQAESGSEAGTDESPGTTFPPASPAASDDDNDDIRLF